MRLNDVVLLKKLVIVDWGEGSSLRSDWLFGREWCKEKCSKSKLYWMSHETAAGREPTQEKSPHKTRWIYEIKGPLHTRCMSATQLKQVHAWTCKLTSCQFRADKRRNCTWTQKLSNLLFGIFSKQASIYANSYGLDFDTKWDMTIEEPFENTWQTETEAVLSVFNFCQFFVEVLMISPFVFVSLSTSERQRETKWL